MNTIVAGTDFSDRGNAAVAKAVELAARLEARVHVVHAWLLPPTAISIELPGTGPLYDQLEKEAQDGMNRLLEGLRAPNVPVESSIVFGDPREVVIAAAERMKATMIVVGTHGPRDSHRPLVGSIAEAIVRLAPCPVLVFR